MAKKLIGKITHYFPKINVAVLELTDTLNTGDRIEIESHETFQQEVDSMEMDHLPVDQAIKGEEVGLEVKQEVKPGDKVYKV